MAATFPLLQSFAFANGEEEELALAYGDRETVSIATGTRQQLRRAPAVASVITAEDIAAMGAVDLDEVMETVPGVHVARNPVCNAAVYAIRGIYNFNNQQVLMLQNGVPMTTMFLGNKGGVWGGLPLENVARIEVIRGPGSALYGADAYAGVINVITKTATDAPGTEFGMRGGSFGSWNAWVQHGGTAGPIEVAAYLRLGSTDGYKKTIAADAQTLRDNSAVPAARSHASLAPGPLNMGADDVDASLYAGYGNWRFNAGYKLRDHVGLGAGVASALDPTSSARSERFNADLSWKDAQFAPHWTVGASASFLYYADTAPVDLLLAPPGAKFRDPTSGLWVAFPDGLIGGPNKWERQWRFSANGTYSGFADHTVRLGVGHDDLNLYKTATYKNYWIDQTTGLYKWTGPVTDYSAIQPFMLPQRRRVNYFYAQDEWRVFRDWTLTAGVRRDDYSDVGGTTNPRLALVWDAAVDVTAKFLVGRAFRAPSFNELYGINNPVNKGNPALKPETIATEEAALSWQARKDLKLNISLFRYTMRDIIRAIANTPAAPQLTTFQNTGEQRGRGMEIEAVWDAGRDLHVTGNYSLQRSIDVATDSDAGYVPHHHLYLRGDWGFAAGWLASAQANWVGQTKRAVGDVRPDVPDYRTVDLTLRTKRGKGAWEFAASIRNLFDAQVLEPSLNQGTTSTVLIPGDLPQAPRSFYLQASYLIR